MRFSLWMLGITAFLAGSMIARPASAQTAAAACFLYQPESDPGQNNPCSSGGTSAPAKSASSKKGSAGSVGSGGTSGGGVSPEQASEAEREGLATRTDERNRKEGELDQEGEAADQDYNNQLSHQVQSAGGDVPSASSVDGAFTGGPGQETVDLPLTGVMASSNDPNPANSPNPPQQPDYSAPTLQQYIDEGLTPEQAQKMVDYDTASATAARAVDAAVADFTNPVAPADPTQPVLTSQSSPPVHMSDRQAEDQMHWEQEQRAARLLAVPMFKSWGAIGWPGPLTAGPLLEFIEGGVAAVGEGLVQDMAVDYAVDKVGEAVNAPTPQPQNNSEVTGSVAP